MRLAVPARQPTLLCAPNTLQERGIRCQVHFAMCRSHRATLDVPMVRHNTCLQLCLWSFESELWRVDRALRNCPGFPVCATRCGLHSHTTTLTRTGTVWGFVRN